MGRLMMPPDEVDESVLPEVRERIADLIAGELDRWVPALLLTEADAAQVLRIPNGRLGRLRKLGQGPPFVRFSKGQVAYRLGELMHWVATLPASTDTAN
jgi:hypothetical protein